VAGSALDPRHGRGARASDRRAAVVGVGAPPRIARREDRRHTYGATNPTRPTLCCSAWFVYRCRHHDRRYGAGV